MTKKSLKDKKEGFSIYIGDERGWMLERNKWVHRVITYTEDEGLKVYKNGHLVFGEQ